MEALKLHRIREEKIGGVIYDKSPAPHFKHSQVCHNVGFKIYEGLKNSMSSVYIENLDYMYDAESDNYLEPDIIICCDTKEIKGGFYYGTPKFVAEVQSPSTVKRDRGIKKDIYEKSGVVEYWILSPLERSVEIYYLEDGHYVLHDAYSIEDDENSEFYNLKTELTLRCFPVTMTLEEIFEIK